MIDVHLEFPGALPERVRQLLLRTRRTVDSVETVRDGFVGWRHLGSITFACPHDPLTGTRFDLLIEHA